MLGERALEQRNSLQPLGLDATHTGKTHANSSIQRSKPDTINVLATLSEDSVEVMNALHSLDLDDDRGLIVEAFVEGPGGVDGSV